MVAEPRTRDSQAGPNIKDEDGEDQDSAQSSREELDDGVKEEEVLQWKFPG